MLIRCVVGNEVGNHFDAVCVSLFDEDLDLFGRSESLVDGSIVGDVISAVLQGRRVPRIDPQGIDAEITQIAELATEPCDVTGTVTVPVRERTDIHLVHNGVAPPVLCGASGGDHVLLLYSTFVGKRWGLFVR